MVNEAPELLPCPFCGTNDPKVEYSDGSSEVTGYNFIGSACCRGCAARVIEHSLQDANGWCTDSRDAVRARLALAWNRRTPDPAAIHVKALAQAVEVAENRYKEWTDGSGVSCDATACSNIADAIRALRPDPSLRVVTVEQLERWVEQWAFTVDQYTEGRQVSDRATIAEMRALIAQPAQVAVQAPDGVAQAAESGDYFGRLVIEARSAATKACAKFPQPNCVTLKVAEEAGEVVRGAVHYAEGRMEWDEVEGEVVQLLAMLIRFVTEGDQVNGVIPPALSTLAGKDET